MNLYAFILCLFQLVGVSVVDVRSVKQQQQEQLVARAVVVVAAAA